MKPLPFSWYPNACNRSSEIEHELANSERLSVPVSPGRFKCMLGAISFGDECSLIDVLEGAYRKSLNTVWISEWDCALPTGCARYMSIGNRAPPAPVANYTQETRGWYDGARYTYQEFLQHVKAKRPSDSLEFQGLYAAMMWSTAGAHTVKMERSGGPSYKIAKIATL